MALEFFFLIKYFIWLNFFFNCCTKLLFLLKNKTLFFVSKSYKKDNCTWLLEVKINFFYFKNLKYLIYFQSSIRSIIKLRPLDFLLDNLIFSIVKNLFITESYWVKVKVKKIKLNTKK